MRFFLNIRFRKPYPACCLSNFADHTFLLDGIPVRSMESLIQSLKVPARDQRAVCRMDGWAARKTGSRVRWQEGLALLHWNGRFFRRYSREYYSFLKRAYDALADQNEDYTQALLDTGSCILWYSVGKMSKKKTCLTSLEFVSLLCRERRRVRKRWSKPQREFLNPPMGAYISAPLPHGPV